MTVNLNTALPFVPIEQFSIQSVWRQHKVKILSAVALSICSIVAITLYDRIYWIHAADGGKCPSPNPNDKFNHYMCIGSKWHQAAYVPLSELEERAKACSLGEKITGCVDGKYFHHQSSECLNNPKGYFCEETTHYEDPFRELKE